MNKRKSKVIENLRRSFYLRDEFLVSLSKKLEIFLFLNQKERERGIIYLRKTIIKEIRDIYCKNKIKEQMEHKQNE